MKRSIMLAAAAALLGGAASVQAQDEPGAIANMVNKDGESVGTVSFTESDAGVLVRAKLDGLPGGWHGFHIHQTGKCKPDFGAAGGHFNPTNASHGLLHGMSHHAGDLPNIFVDDNGKARADMFTDAVTLDANAISSLQHDGGTAVIVHTNADSYGEDAGAGDRIACGVVKVSK